MKLRHRLLPLVVWSLLATSYAAAQEPAPAGQPGAAPAAPAAPPVVPLESDDPAVQAVLNSKSTKPADLLQNVKLLLDLEEYPLARAMLVKAIEAAADDAALVELGRTFGKREVLRLSEAAVLQPEGKPFAEKILAALNAADRDPARIANLIQQLQQPGYDQRVATLNNLRSGGEAAIRALVDGLLDPNRAAEHTMLRTALAAFGDDGVGPLQALAASGDAALSLGAIKSLGQIEGPTATNELYAHAYAKQAAPTVRQAAQAALAQRLGKLPTQQEAALGLFLAAEHLYRAPRPSPAEPQPLVSLWNWNAQAKQAVQSNSPKFVADAVTAARWAEAAAALTDDPAARRLALLSSLEAEWLLHPDAEVPQADIAAAWLARHRPTPRDWEAMYHLAMELKRFPAAAICVEQFSRSGDADQLLYAAAGRPTLLVQAAVSPVADIRFAAVEAIMKAQPARPFAGSSGVADSLAWFINTDGNVKQLVVDADVARGRDFAALATNPQTSIAVLGDVRAAAAYAAAEADLTSVVVRRNLLEPAQGNFLARLRSDYRTARLPVIVLCEPEELDRTRTRFYKDPNVIAMIAPFDQSSFDRQTSGLVLPTDAALPPADERLRRAQFALAAMQHLLETKNPVFNLQPYEPYLLRAAMSPKLSESAGRVLALFGSPAAQRTLAEVANATARPLEVRQAAAAAFCQNVLRFGTLLTTAEILRQYEVYNASEALDKPTQQLLASMLDAVELRAGKVPARAADAPPPAEAVPPAPASPPASDPAPAAAP